MLLVQAFRSTARLVFRFSRLEAAGGILLMLATLVALVWSNSPWGASYCALWHAPVGVRLGTFTFERTLEWIVNDGLMAIFFFVVGLEIRREIHHGELSTWRRASLPAAAALGGMLVPASVYLVLAGAESTRSGWGVPMATDIAFAVGILSMLGKRVPTSLRVLLLALAVIDDLGAILVIALFYASGIAIGGLLVAALGLAGILLLQRLGFRARGVYLVPAFVTWAGIYAAGIHPTIAGVLVGLLTPVRPPHGADVVGVARKDLDELADLTSRPFRVDDLAGTIRRLSPTRRDTHSPADSLIEALQPWVAFLIMPIFALANAGVSLKGTSLDGPLQNVVFGVGIALCLGKPVGVLLAVWVALKLGIGALPQELRRRHLVVLGVLAGIGFTMSLFIAQLAFSEPEFLAAAKLGVLCASALAAFVALAMGRLLLTPATDASNP